MSSDTGVKVLAVIPARFASTRFPGKVLALLGDKPLVWHVHNRVQQATLVDEVWVATDDERVRAALAPEGIHVVMTRQDHLSGTDRVAEAAAASDAGIIVNVQGDEVLIDPATVDAAIRPLLDSPDIPMATARHLISDLHDVEDPNVVKVVCDERGRALYFSRSPIPHVRDASDDAASDTCYWQHVGIYVFRKDFLMQFTRMAPTTLEKLEKLEQLRVLENGYPIAVVDTEYRGVSVDTPEDLKRVEEILRAGAAQ